MTFSIPTFRKVDVEKRLEKLSRKAVKYGNADIKFFFGATRQQVRKTENGERTYEFIDIHVVGEAPRVAGWDFLARVELMSGGENLIHRVPGVDLGLDESFRTHNGHCDHCNTLRPRNDVYVLANGTEQIAVGRSCLRDFLGIDDPKSIVNRAQFFEELRSFEEEDMIGLFAKYGYFDLKEVLMFAAAFIRSKGYVSRAKQKETGYETTGQCVQYSIRAVPGYEIEITQEDRNWADKTVEFFRSADTFKNDYMNNLRVLMKQDIVKVDHVNLIASAVLAAQRELIPKSDDAKESNYVGEEKQRLKGLDLLLEKIIFLGPNTWGPSFLHLFKDENGNVFSWITSSKLEVAEGTLVKLDASVKQHKSYNGVKQTVLTRTKVQ